MSNNNDSEVLNILNISEQTISIQLSVRGADFFNGQQQAHLGPNKNILIDSKYLIDGQVDNLKLRGVLRVSKIRNN